MKNKVIEESIDDSTRQLLDLVESANIEKQELEKIITSLEETKDKLDDDIAFQVSKLDRASVLTKEQEDRFFRLECSIAERVKDATKLDDDIRAKKSELSDLQVSSDELLQQIETAKKQFADVYKAASDADIALSVKEENLATRIKDVEKREQELSSNEVTFNEKSLSLANDIRIFNQNKESWENQYKNDIDTIEQSKKELSDRRVLLYNVEKELNDRISEIKNREASLQTESEKLDETKQSLDELALDLDRKIKDQQDKERSLSVEEMRINALEKEISDREKILLYKEKLA